MSRVGIVALLLGSQLVIGVGALAAAKDDHSAAASPERMNVRLAATRYNAGQIGLATLVSVDGKTSMTVEISGVPPYTTRPIHLRTRLFEGSCANRKPVPMYESTRPGLAESLIAPDAIGAFRGPARIRDYLPISFQALRAIPFAISVRTEPPDGNVEIFCGDTAS